MSVLLLLIGALALVVLGFTMLSRRRRRVSGPENNWQNEDFMSREDVGSWAEGSTQTPIGPKSGVSIVPGVSR